MEKQIECPKCGSTQIHADKKGFSTGKAVVGGLLTGNILVAAASGGIGMNKIELTCLKCGHKFKPGECEQIMYHNSTSQQELKEFESHVIKPEEHEKTQMYCCDCGKKSCLSINSPICPKCGRRLNEKHKFTPEYRKGCAAVILLFILLTGSLISMF